MVLRSVALLVLVALLVRCDSASDSASTFTATYSGAASGTATGSYAYTEQFVQRGAGSTPTRSRLARLVRASPESSPC